METLLEIFASAFNIGNGEILLVDAKTGTSRIINRESNYRLIPLRGKHKFSK